jgi:hypothetical protein
VLDVTTLQIALGIWLGGLLFGVSGLAVYIAFRSTPGPQTPLVSRALYHLGQGLIGLVVLVILGGILAVAARAVWVALGGR